jgi:putative ATP-binding cassette transporter
MEFFKFLKRESDEFGRQLLLIGVFAGGVSTAMMFLLNNAATKVSQGQPVKRSMILFGLCLVAYWISKGYLLRKTTRLVEEIVERVRLRIADKVKDTDLSALESIGAAPLFNAISTHPLSISRATPQIISAATSMVLIFFACTFIRFYSTMGFLIFVVALGAILGMLMLSGKKVMAILDKTTTKDNEFVTSFDHLLHGFKELKMNSVKCEEFFERELRPLANESKDLRTETGRIATETALLASSALFMLLALIVFLLPVLSPNEIAKISSVATLVVFIFGPLSEVVAVYPQFTQAEASIRAIYSVEEQLRQYEKTAVHEDHHPHQPIKEFKDLKCDKLAFNYIDQAGQTSFSLEPVNFKAKKGEMIFITGGNGSGKSTFLKVLAGLYPAASGKILINGVLVGPHNRQAFRNLFAPIFTDFHLFKRLYGVATVDQESIFELLDMTDLAQKTQIIDKEISNLNLSTGQRKRLALVIAMLEEKPIFLFDEWASEQDPVFRRKFYEEILPEMKKRGKTIIAVTHDDDYYDVADKVLKMQYGRFV